MTIWSDQEAIRTKNKIGLIYKIGSNFYFSPYLKYGRKIISNGAFLPDFANCVHVCSHFLPTYTTFGVECY